MTLMFASAEDAEETFYEALGRGDLDALMAVWAEDEEIVCIHPTGQRLTGHAAIRESWRAIFANNPRFTVHIKRKLRWDSVLLAVHSVVETLSLGDKPTQRGPMQSTNVFQRGASGWRMLSCHASAATSTETGETGGDPQRTLH